MAKKVMKAPAPKAKTPAPAPKSKKAAPPAPKPPTTARRLDDLEADLSVAYARIEDLQGQMRKLAALIREIEGTLPSQARDEAQAFLKAVGPAEVDHG